MNEEENLNKKQCKVSKDLIKSISYDQQEIINNILKLYNKGQPIHFDPCYNVGGFYKNGVVSDPVLKSDINPQLESVLKLDVRDLPFDASSIKSIIFDPPFIVSGNSKCKMAQRYGSFSSLEELKTFYKDSLISLQRVLKHGGLLIFKFQDFIIGRKQHLILPYIYSVARELNFAVRDLFILLAKNRIGYQQNQNHARKYHCYFLVLKCNKRQDKK